ncbi:hypothetical protein GCM10027341_17570 [Spirosoma knui]
MNNEQSSENDAWEERFRKLGQLPSESPKPFFYTRLQARMERQTTPAPAYVPQWLRRPAYALAAFGLIVVLNMGVALRYVSTDTSQATTDATTYESFVADYQLTTNTDYVDE